MQYKEMLGRILRNDREEIVQEIGEAGPERLRAWCELAAAEAGSVLTREEVRAVLLAAKEAAEDGIREARGN